MLRTIKYTYIAGYYDLVSSFYSGLYGHAADHRESAQDFPFRNRDPSRR